MRRRAQRLLSIRSFLVGLALAALCGAAACDEARSSTRPGADRGGGSWYPSYPQISNHDDTPIWAKDSTIE